MKTFNRVVILTFIIGVVLVGVAFGSGFDFRNLSDYFIDDEAYGSAINYNSTTIINKLDVDVDMRHIVIEHSDMEFIEVIYYSKDDDTWTINEINGSLSIKQKENPSPSTWFSFKTASYDVRSVKILIPSDLLLDYNLKSDTGDIKISGLEEAKDMILNTDTGRIKVDHTKMDSLSIDNDTGSINLEYLEITNNLDVQLDTGTTNLEHITANFITVNAVTGKIDIKAINAETLDVQSNTGSISIDYTLIVGIMDIKADTGSISVSQSAAATYHIQSDTGSVNFSNTSIGNISCDLYTDTGSVSVNGDHQGSRYKTTRGSVQLNIDVDTGSISVTILD